MLGYRNEAKLRTTKEGFEIMKKEIDEYLENRETCGIYKPKNLFDCASFINDNGKVVTVDWFETKWYDNYIEVMAFDNALKTLKDKNIDFQFVKMNIDLNAEEDDEYDEDGIEKQINMNNNSFELF